MLLPVWAADADGLHVVAVEWDDDASTVRFERSDGKEAVFPSTRTLAGRDLGVRPRTWFPEQSLLLLETRRGHRIFTQLPTRNDLAPIDGRPVIYLDQNQWSTIAKTIHTPAKVPSADERAAARQLIDLAITRRVILPMSSAHMSETCQWTNDDARYHLALTILQLSGGWQMRYPVDVRVTELASALAQRFDRPLPPQRPVFTLEPNAVHGITSGMTPIKRITGVPDRLAFAHLVLTAVSGNFGTMLDAEPVQMNAVPGWVAKNQAFTDWMETENRTREQKRGSTDVLLLDDLQKESAIAAHGLGLAPEHLGSWIGDGAYAEDLRRMPCLGLFREMLHEKAINPSTVWNPNDLTDIMYLTCGAGYADYLVTERSAAAKLRSAVQRLDRPATMYRNLTELSPVLEELEAGSPVAV